MRIRIPLSAGIPARQAIRAQSVVIASTGAAASVDFNVFGTDWQDVEGFGQCERLFSIFDASRQFTGVELTAAVDCVVELLVSRSRVEVMDGATVDANITGPLSGGRVATETKALGFNITQTVVAITAASQQVLAANPARRYLAFMVVGSADVTIKPDAAAVAGAGMVLQAQGVGKQGGSFTFDGAAPTDAFHAIGTGVGSNLIVWEGV